jgi:hypothetical protein
MCRYSVTNTNQREYNRHIASLYNTAVQVHFHAAFNYKNDAIRR